MQVQSKDFPGWFADAGAYVLVDGQYGSTGKGVVAALLASLFGKQCDYVVSNAGPNSGHTFFHEGTKHVLKQLPTFAVAASLQHNRSPNIYLDAGAVIDPEVLTRELQRYDVHTRVHPHAAVITPAAKERDANNVQRVASTGQGVGEALRAKLERNQYNDVYQGLLWREPNTGWLAPAKILPASFLQELRCFVEVSQGFSLGLNSGFYPHVTTRECTVSQALSDAGLSPRTFRKSVLSVRTFPIRVGNTENSSGPGYSDQAEINWEDIGVEPEYTTVTKRKRRVFTWSRLQFMEAVVANAPDAIFLNFVNYLPPDEIEEFVVQNVLTPYTAVIGHEPETLLLGFGPNIEDVRVWDPRGYV